MNQQNNQYEEAKSKMLESVKKGLVSLDFAKTIFPDICIDNDYERIRKCIRTIIQIKKEGSFGLECNGGATWDEILTWLENRRFDFPGKEGAEAAIWCIDECRLRSNDEMVIDRCYKAEEWVKSIREKLYKE